MRHEACTVDREIADNKVIADVVTFCLRMGTRWFEIPIEVGTTECNVIKVENIYPNAFVNMICVKEGKSLGFAVGLELAEEINNLCELDY